LRDQLANCRMLDLHAEKVCAVFSGRASLHAELIDEILFNQSENSIPLRTLYHKLGFHEFDLGTVDVSDNK